MLLAIHIPACDISPVPNHKDLTVIVGQENIFTQCNYHDTGFFYELGKQPDEREVYSKGNTARVSLLALPGHAGAAFAETGVEFKLDTAGYTLDEVKHLPVSVSIDLSYEISAYWTEEYGFSRVEIYIPGFLGEGYNSIYFTIEEPGNKREHVNIHFETRPDGQPYSLGNLLSNDSKIIVLVYCQVKSFEEATGPRSSFASVKLVSIKVDLPE